MWESGKAPDALVEELGLKQISNTSVIEKVVDDIIAANMDKVEAYKGSKVQLFGLDVGQRDESAGRQGESRYGE